MLLTVFIYLARFRYVKKYNFQHRLQKRLPNAASLNFLQDQLVFFRYDGTLVVGHINNLYDALSKLGSNVMAVMYDGDVKGSSIGTW